MHKKLCALWFYSYNDLGKAVLERIISSGSRVGIGYSKDDFRYSRRCSVHLNSDGDYNCCTFLKMYRTLCKFYLHKLSLIKTKRKHPTLATIPKIIECLCCFSFCTMQNTAVTETCEPNHFFVSPGTCIISVDCSRSYIARVEERSQRINVMNIFTVFEK